jgi:hypothetical protein
MDSKFVPPVTKAEFLKRASGIPLQGASGVLNSLKSRRSALVRSLDQEIYFYQKVVELHEVGEEKLKWGNE